MLCSDRPLTCPFDFLLTGDAISCPRHSLQSLGIDSLSARQTLAKAAVPDPPERILYHLQQMPFVCTLPKQEVLGVRACSAVDHVGSQAIVEGASGLRFVGNAPSQLLPARFEPFPKLFHPLLVYTAPEGCDYSADAM